MPQDPGVDECGCQGRGTLVVWIGVYVLRLRSLCGVDLAREDMHVFTVNVRGACPGDLDKIIDFYSSLSLETIYSRFMSASRNLRPYIERVYAQGGVIIVAEVDDRIIGVAEAVPISGDAAEVGIVVHDDYQGMGIGRILGKTLLKAARITGVKVAKAYVLPGNYRALKLARKLGFRVDRNLGGMLELTLYIS